MNIEQRIADLSWKRIENAIEDQGYSTTPPILTPAECEEVICLYDLSRMFRSQVDMTRHQFGVGEYKYFADPLPAVVEELRKHFYPPLAHIANHWLGTGAVKESFPDNLTDYLRHCEEYGQTRPTPLMLRYEAGGYNCLHQDVYGALAFPLQAACVLNQHGIDYTGGEFLILEQRSQSQMRGTAITIEQGAFVIFPNNKRPTSGRRGYDLVNVRHGISTVTSGVRYTLGIIFHNAK